MRFFPIFLRLAGRTVLVSGAGEVAAAKVRLLLKSEAAIRVLGASPCDAVREWAEAGRLDFHERLAEAADLKDAVLVYAANDDLEEDRRVAALARDAGVAFNIVDNLDESEFLTPAIVDRDPVTVAIGTEGTAPVLARRIKAGIEEMLPSNTGILARIGAGFRDSISHLSSSARRSFWSRFFGGEGERALALGGEATVSETLAKLASSQDSVRETEAGHVSFVGAGPGDPDLLTMQARRALHDADVVLHDRLVAPEILELVRREAEVVCVGKTGFGESWKQDNINALMVRHALAGRAVARVKSGDPSVFGRLDEETDVLIEAGISYTVVPGITAASAAAASIGASLTQRGRNSALTILTGHDVKGFAEQDWAKLARPGSAAAIYMGVKAARFIAGRLLMHGAAADTPVTIAANVSRANQQMTTTTLAGLAALSDERAITGPAVLLDGIAPKQAAAIAAEPHFLKAEAI